MAPDNPGKDNPNLMPQQESDIYELQRQVRRNDRTLELGRGQINHVFSVSGKLQQGSAISDDELVSPVNSKDIPSISASSIRALSVQLNKLRIMELQIKINSLTKSVEHVTKKNASLATECNALEQQLESARVKIPQHRQGLENKHATFSEGLETLINEYKVHKIGHIQRQSVKSQQHVFSILKEALFSRARDGSLLFYNQPILGLSSFFTTSILFVNQFLENLITLQRHISFIFNINLPHLKDLVVLLPNSRFYSLIREKEILMTGKSDEEEEEEEEPSKESIVPSPPNPENVIKLGDAIKLPLSSKTINSQRRAQILRQETEIPVLKADSVSPPRVSEKSEIIPSGAPPRKMIIIPHRILNKPFNKLSIKEFLRFLLVIAKIISNFVVFFKIINDDYINSMESTLDFRTILEHVNQPSSAILSTFPEQDLTDKLSLKQLMEQIYRQLISPPPRDRRASAPPPSLLQDLNVSALIANQAKLQNDDWDVVSKME